MKIHHQFKTHNIQPISPTKSGNQYVDNPLTDEKMGLWNSLMLYCGEADTPLHRHPPYQQSYNKLTLVHEILRFNDLLESSYPPSGPTEPHDKEMYDILRQPSYRGYSLLTACRAINGNPLENIDLLDGFLDDVPNKPPCSISALYTSLKSWFKDVDYEYQPCILNHFSKDDYTVFKGLLDDSAKRMQKFSTNRDRNNLMLFLNDIAQLKIYQQKMTDAGLQPSGLFQQLTDLLDTPLCFQSNYSLNHYMAMGDAGTTQLYNLLLETDTPSKDGPINYLTSFFALQSTTEKWWKDGHEIVPEELEKSAFQPRQSPGA